MFGTKENLPIYGDSVEWNLEFLQAQGLNQDQAAQTLIFKELVWPFYEPETDYHNSHEHIEEGFLAAMSLCRKANDEGHEVDMLKVAIAYLGHDAGYNHDLFESYNPDKWGLKENYHSYITVQLLLTMGFDKTFIGDIQSCILATAVHFECQSIEQEITRLADTSNVPSPYENFVLKSCEFFKESLDKGARMDLNMFRSIASQVLSKYFSGIKILKDLDKDETGKSLIERGYANIEKFSRETPESIIKMLGAHAARFTNVLLSKSKSEPVDDN